MSTSKNQPNPYENLTNFYELYNEAIKFLFNLTKKQKKSDLRYKVEKLKEQFEYVMKSKYEKDFSEIEDSEILKDIINDKNIKANTNIKNNKNRFNFRRKDVFLTYSKADNEPDIKQIFKELKDLDKDKDRPDKICNNIELFFLVKELHEDGVPHFHVYMKFFEALDRSDYTLFNIPSLKSPKIVYVHNKRKVIRYMAKHLKTEEDWKENSIQYNMDAKFYIETNAYMLSELAYKMIKKQITPTQAITESPNLIYKADSLYRNYNIYHFEKHMEENPGKDLIDISIGKKELNPLKFKFDKTKKKNENPQFWICGNTNSGKTYVTDMLEQNGYNGYMPSMDEENWEGYNDKYINYIEFEEFKGEKTIRFLNRLLEGTKMPLKVKGRDRVIKNKNIPVFIKSNYLPHEAYSKVDHNTINLLLQRIYVIYLDKNKKAHLIWNPKTDTFKNDYNFELNCLNNEQMEEYIKCKESKLPFIFKNKQFNENYINPNDYIPKPKTTKKCINCNKIHTNNINLCLSCKEKEKSKEKQKNNNCNICNIELVNGNCFNCLTKDFNNKLNQDINNETKKEKTNPNSIPISSQQKSLPPDIDLSNISMKFSI
jgi:hypothetical protein